MSVPYVTQESPFDRLTAIVPNSLTQGPLLALVGPASLSVFALGFLCTWLLDRKRRYLLIFAAATLSYCLGALCQILVWPSNPGHNTMLSTFFYTGSTLALIDGIMRRSGQRLGFGFVAFAMAGIMTLTYYFNYVTPSLLTRIYLHNFGYGVMFLYAAVRLRRLRGGKPIDRVLYWVFVLFGIHFFPRTAATLGLEAPDTLAAFANSSFWIGLQISLAVFGVLLALTLLAAATIDRIDDLKTDRDTDSLTGALNRRGFEERAHALLTQGESYPASIILADIDHFKLINDSFGHGVGDKVLQRFSLVVAGCLRNGDLLARIGGEEFAMIVQRCDANGGVALAERMRTSLSRESFPDAGSRPVTASYGIVEIRPGEPLWQAVDRADLMLYAAKDAGRNRVASWEKGKARFSDRLTVVA